MLPDFNMRHILYAVFSFHLINYCYSYEPITTAAGLIGGVILSAGYATWNYASCKYYECCDDTWVNFRPEVLQNSLKKNLYGQHLAEYIISKSLEGYLRNPNPKKAFVMSFHGLTGSGKNYVSSMIAESLYKNRTSSNFVHLYIATKHFPHKEEVPKYKDILRREIPHFTKLCGRSLFIFDEVDKMPAGILDAVKPYIDYYDQVDGVDYRKNIFLFLSNSGSSQITKVALNFWAEGKEREDITMKDIESLVSLGAFNEKGGLQNSEIVRSELIDVYIPFLPLEKKHIKLCIKSELLKKNMTVNLEIINRIADQLMYFPSGTELYSTSGCKRIPQKVDVYGN